MANILCFLFSVDDTLNSIHLFQRYFSRWKIPDFYQKNSLSFRYSYGFIHIKFCYFIL